MGNGHYILIILFVHMHHGFTKHIGSSNPLILRQLLFIGYRRDHF